MQELYCPRTRASLLIPHGGESPSGRGFVQLRDLVKSCQKSSRPYKKDGQGCFASRRVGTAAQYDDSRHQRLSQRGPATGQRKVPQYDYDFAPSAGTARPPAAPPSTPPGGGPGGPEDKNSNLKNYLIAGAFFIGMGTGVWFDSGASFTPSNVASTEIVDRKTPNSEICMASGYSSMVFDQRIFVSFNPFNVYVAQPEVKPGCVLRQSNVSVLEKRKLVNDKEVSSCTRSSNTFAFVGDLDKSPEVSCVYHSEDAENQFLKNPRRAVLGDGFRGTDPTAKAPVQ